MIEFFLVALVLTILIETGALVILREINFLKLNKIKLNKILFVWFFASFATLPYLWFVLSNFVWSNYELFTVVWEFSVVFVESIIFYFVLELKFYRAFLLSFIVNFISWFIWLIIF